MGISFSSRRRRRRNNNPFCRSSPSQLLYISPDTSYLSAPPPSSTYPSTPPPPNYFSFPPQNSSHVPSPPSYSSNNQYTGGYNDYPSYYANHVDDSTAMRTPSQSLPPSVDRQGAKKVKNDINVRKDTIKLEVDEMNPDCHLVSFTVDAMVDGSITVFYFAKEGADCSFSPLYPEACMPVRMPFQKGLGQKFRQSPGTGIDLGFFELDDLSKPSTGEDVFPLVILAEAWLPTQPADSQLGNAQITQAILGKNNGDSLHVRVVKQILWVDGVRYELREIYGIGDSVEAGLGDNDEGKECVICMTEPKDTAVLPCRHLCMCRECANELKNQSNKCPICRQAIQELLEI
ncbi:probable E3 ubiquitin-protein ligase LUL3 isoform X2 [Telopea speciosissima]|uniref:probable E3 ubiquitin-protein ligase LUL3 isoform X2 n=1 Tax=Telopea speciosissima TaxID=54955 RepID=UPI001CC4F99D|nr:probable E3 ubiquitin-protein ligase LUL3 isoform X2 [Telopea speciosissima]